MYNINCADLQISLIRPYRLGVYIAAYEKWESTTSFSLDPVYLLKSVVKPSYHWMRWCLRSIRYNTVWVSHTIHFMISMMMFASNINGSIQGQWITYIDVLYYLKFRGRVFISTFAFCLGLNLSRLMEYVPILSFWFSTAKIPMMRMD